MTVRLVVVTGARDFLYPEVVHHRLDELHSAHGPFDLFHGACGWTEEDPDGMTGADRYADDWGKSVAGVRVKPFPADWNGPLRKGAGPARNAKMVREAVFLVPREQVLGLAFPGARSRGTWNCVTRMRQERVQVDVWGPNRVQAWLRNKNRPSSQPN